MIQIKITWILLYVSMKNIQVYKWLNRILEFLKISFRPISEDEIKNMIKDLKNSKSVGG